MNDLIEIKKNNLPVTIDELYKFILIGKDILKAHKAKISAIEKIDSAYSAKKAALKDAQDIAEIVLDAEAKLGEILDKIPRKYVGSLEGTNVPNQEKTLPPNITKKTSHQAKTIYRNPDIVEQVKKEARKKDDIPTSKQIYDEVKKHEKIKQKIEAIEKLKIKIPNIKEKFDIIIIDPPWDYQKRAEDVTHRAANPYPSMSIQEIINYKINNRSIKDLAEENCILWLWTTNAFMRHAYEILDAWGFKEKTILTWKKDKIGLGDWLRGITEHCIMSIKGKPIVNLINQTTFLEGKAREHSRKPIEFYHMVFSLCPGIAIDIFSRERLENIFPKKIISMGVEMDKFV